jgi:hypothetical protein
LQLVPSNPQPLKGVKVYEVEAAAPIRVGFGEPSPPDQRVDYVEKPPRLGDIV